MGFNSWSSSKIKGSINLPLAEVKSKNFERTSHISSGKEAITKYTVLWKGKYKKIKISLVEFNPKQEENTKLEPIVTP